MRQLGRFGWRPFLADDDQPPLLQHGAQRGQVDVMGNRQNLATWPARRWQGRAGQEGFAQGKIQVDGALGPGQGQAGQLDSLPVGIIEQRRRRFRQGQINHCFDVVPV